MLSLQAVQQRDKIKHDQRVVDMMQSWWDGMKLKSDDGKYISKHAYVLMSTTLHRVLLPDDDHGDAQDIAEHDWETDNLGNKLILNREVRKHGQSLCCFAGKDEMDYDTFFDSMVSC